MWPFFVLFNKILRTEEEEEEEKIHVSDGNHAMVKCSKSEWSSSNGKCRDAVLPCAHFVEVPHINQLFTWDCGLACVSMVLRTFGINSYNIQGLADLCCTTSIWTVDLAYLLQKFNIRFSYFTVTFGANPNYSVETFYKEQLPNDLVRVDMLFQKARGAGINIEFNRWNRNFSNDIIRKLYCNCVSRPIQIKSILDGDVIIPGFYGNDSGYTGHYVVICGYDVDADEFEIRDPASSRIHERVSSKRLEEARKSFGTDEDILLISLDKNEKQISSSV
ncbi:hypothetical protein Dsin_002862 [Dipteronia sinensis]|uniref:Guanylyl cyclase n=1 Tax=Dipteronia sinensis TaxID=43782 RepID=A0AAE0B6J4_9ROSI|nr:hypothetical protein Dsin_002862 [Dipteronia sinensis]